MYIEGVTESIKFPIYWKNFEINKISLADYEEVFEHLHANFFLSTPLTNGLTYSKEYFDEFDKIYRCVLSQNLSLCAKDVTLNKVAALRIIFVQDKSLEKQFEEFQFKTPQMKVMNLIMGTVSKNANVYAHFGVTSFVNFYTACVDPQFRGQGLASKMYEIGISMIKQNSNLPPVVKSNITSPYTLKICKSFGFKELARAYYNDFKDAEGKPMLRDRTNEQFVAFMAKRYK